MALRVSCLEELLETVDTVDVLQELSNVCAKKGGYLDKYISMELRHIVEDLRAEERT